MKRWYAEDWSFKIEVLRVGKENLHTECRCGGDLRNLGGKEPGEITFLCPDGAVLFRITAEHIPET